MTRRGEIYYVDWSPGRGSEQAGIRPALIIQNDVGNQFSPTTIVVAISTQQRRPYPFHVAITPQESGLPRDSVVKCEQIQTIEQARLGRLAGVLSRETMQEVDLALDRSLGLEPAPGTA
jgi:mRNA interferase MazF